MHRERGQPDAGRLIEPAPFAPADLAPLFDESAQLASAAAAEAARANTCSSIACLRTGRVRARSIVDATASRLGIDRAPGAGARLRGHLAPSRQLAPILVKMFV